MNLKAILNNATDTGKQSTARIEHLDGWRGMAIFFVLLQHFFIPLDSIFLFFGSLGVDIFFVLSGMLMSKILFEKRVPLDVFYKRRISRILPVFFVFILVTYLYAFYIGSDEASNWFYSLFFLRTYFPLDNHIWETNVAMGHLWSLNVEEHCYMLLSAITLIAILKGREAFVLIGLGCLSILIKVLYKAFPEVAPADGFLHTEAAASFLLLSAGYYLVRDKFEHFVQPWMIIVCFLLIVAISSQRGGWIVTPFLLAFCVNHLHKAPSLVLKLLSSWPLRLLGIYSYSIYLWQQPLYKYLVKGKEIDPLFSIFYFFVAIAIGALSFYLIEQKARAWLNNNW